MQPGALSSLIPAQILTLSSGYSLPLPKLMTMLSSLSNSRAARAKPRLRETLNKGLQLKLRVRLRGYAQTLTPKRQLLIRCKVRSKTCKRSWIAHALALSQLRPQVSRPALSSGMQLRPNRRQRGSSKMPYVPKKRRRSC